MATGSLYCAKCGQRLIGNGHRFLSKNYCDSCYEKEMVELEALEAEKDRLYGYIKELFGISECPSEVIYAIENNIKYGKKVSGIRATLWYYYEIQGHTTDISFLNKIIKEQYDNARKYIESARQIKKQNDQTNLNVEPITVKLHSNINKKKRSAKYKMEDL